MSERNARGTKFPLNPWDRGVPEREVDRIRWKCDIGHRDATITVSNFGILRLACTYGTTHGMCKKTGRACDGMMEEQRRRSYEDD